MARRKILIIDDEKGFTSMLRLNLESTGVYEVFEENNPIKAMNAALEHNPDLILLDIVMPNKEGPDVAVELRSNQKLKTVPIIFLTATVRQSEVDSEGGYIGGHHFIAKPSNLPALLESIERNI
ncbi:MAG: response regulator [Candidatus Omnitrophica bacterium]|nr:response regulator [Candidatus Omnitrophota bacterium]